MRKIKWWGVALIVIGVILLAVAGRYLYVMFMNPMSAFDAPSPSPSPTAQVTVKPQDDAVIDPFVATPVPTLSPEEALLSSADLEFMKNRVNILMLGWDESPERTDDEDSELFRGDSNNFRSDVLMLLTVDFDQKSAKLISIPRDTLAPIYNTKGHWKINAAFAKGGSAKGNGFEYALKTVSNLLGGIPIDYYAGVNMTGIKAVVDAMNGVDYDVDVRIVLNGRVLETGMQHLNGQQVLDYCRARKGISTDVGRADRQQRILMAIFQQLKSSNQLVNLPKIYAGVQGYIQTNLNMEQIAALSVLALNLSDENLTRATLEGKYISNTAYSSASFYVLYNSKLVKLVKDTFGVTIKPNPRYDVAYVEGQSAAKCAMSYIETSDYLLQLSASTQGAQAASAGGYTTLEQAKMDCLALIDFEDEDTPKLLSADDIKSAQSKLSDAIVATAASLGFTQASAQKLFPKDIIERLPVVASPSLVYPGDVPNFDPPAHGDGSSSGGDFGGFTVDPEAME